MCKRTFSEVNQCERGRKYILASWNDVKQLLHDAIELGIEMADELLGSQVL